MILPMAIQDMPPAARSSLLPLLDECFEGVYRWHARRTLRKVPWVRAAIRCSERIGVAMLTMLGSGAGYVYYIAVIPSWRAAGIGGQLLDDAIRTLLAAEAREVLACVRSDNAPSIRLLLSRGFAKTRFRELARSRGFLKAVILWIGMVAVPGEEIYAKVFPPANQK